EITYPTGQLVDLLAKVAVRLGSANYTAAPALRRLDQGMGGGKSHACIAHRAHGSVRAGRSGS
ncbi:MAG: hypothetical protein ACXVAI_07575, partial [Candidatus Limnocylindrales bacterium]